MPHYQIALTVTVVADTEEDARDLLRDFMTTASIGEPGPIEDFSIEETMEEY